MQSRDGRPGYDTGAAGAVASGTYGAAGSGGFDGTAGGASTTYPSSVPPVSSSHGISLPHATLPATSSPSLPLVLPTRADLETVKLMMRMQTTGTPQECVWKPVQTLQSQQIASSCQVSTAPRRFTGTQQPTDQPLRSSIVVSLQTFPAVPRRRNHRGAYDRDRTAERVNLRGVELDGNFEGGALQ